MTGYEHQCEKFSSAFLCPTTIEASCVESDKKIFAVEILYREKTNNDRAFKTSTQHYYERFKKNMLILF
jgi:hypothetical protein